MPTPKLSCATQAIDAVDLEMLSTPTCRWRNPNYRLNTEIKAVLFQETTSPTLPCHEGPAADACTLVDNAGPTAWTWRCQGDRRR